MSRVLRTPFLKKTILKFHRLARGETWDAGKYKAKDSHIIEKYPNGRSRVRFRTVPAAQTAAYMKELVDIYSDSIAEQKIPPLVLISAFNLDFLCIHPFRDGNGRVLTAASTPSVLPPGLGVGRYISLERLIEQNKERYYETLEQSSYRWHESKHDHGRTSTIFSSLSRARTENLSRVSGSFKALEEKRRTSCCVPLTGSLAVFVFLKFR